MARRQLFWLFFAASLFATEAALGQPADPLMPEAESAETEADEPSDAVPEQVDVQPGAADSDISARLERILEATEWFADPQVSVDEGVVFLSGRVSEEQHKAWAGKLAGNTEDVVAVVNRIVVEEASMWDLSPAWIELKELAAETVRSSPLILLGLVLLALTWWAAKLSVRLANLLLERHVSSPLLRDVAARATAAPVFLLGLYLVLRISGLTRLAVTVLGGTGLIGLVVGFAFRDIAENFLASILISAQNPFARGDLIQVAEHKGFVQRVNTRATLLMTLDGNHVQIPNATIYKETIVNFTANSNGRFEFSVGIGYDDSIAKAQTTALETLREHPAVLTTPEPLILVEALGAATVNLTVYFWVNIVEHSGLKVRSAVIRQVKRAFDEAGISMPDEAREVVFPQGIPVSMIEADEERETGEAVVEHTEPASHEAEGDLDTEAREIEEAGADIENSRRGRESSRQLIMSTYLLNLWDTVRTGYWFVPSIFVVGALLLALSMPSVDASLKSQGVSLPEWIVTTTDTARTTLSTMAGAMIGVTGTVFSITIVTLSLTSQQFGPRLLRRFMYDLTTQITLGAFLSTGFYCLIVLRIVENNEDGLVAPHLAVLTGVVLAGLSMVMLIIFIHHVAVMIQAPNVVAAVANDLDDAIKRIFPERIGESAEDDGVSDEVARQVVMRLSADPVAVTSRHEGYVQAIDGEGLLLLASEEDLVFRIQSQPGDFITDQSRLVEIWDQGERPTADFDLDRLSERLNEMFITGIRRTPRQDAICAIDELVEVAVRSLSPGINDPFTAINCIDRLHASLSRIAARHMPSPYRREDETGRLRVIAQPVTFPEILDAAFNQIRQYGRGSVSVTIRLLGALAAIAKHVHRDEDGRALHRQAEMIVQQAEAIPDEPDRTAIRRQYNMLEAAIADR